MMRLLDMCEGHRLSTLAIVPDANDTIGTAPADNISQLVIKGQIRYGRR